MFRSRRVTVALLAGCFGLAAIVLVALNAFNLHFLNPRDSNGIFLFTALSILVFLLLVLLLVLLCRNVLKLYADGKNRLLGSHIRTRLLSGALILSFAPTLFMFLFSYLLMNRSIDRWFSQPVAQLREDSTRVALELSQYAAENARAEAESLASSVTLQRSLDQKDILSALGVVRSHRITLAGGFVTIYNDDEPIVEYAVPRGGAAASPVIRPWMDDTIATRPAAGESLLAFVLAAAHRSDQPVLTLGGVDYVLGTSATPSSSLVVVALPMPAGLARTVGTIRSGTESYWQLFRGRNRIRGTYFLLMLLLTILTLFASSWLALYLAKQVTRPAETLADAMEQISAGHYSHRVTVGATEELGEVIHSFNAMASDLEQSRGLAESSTARLSEVNRTLADRRRELELILDTIPSGVATLDGRLAVVLSNRAMLDLLDFETSVPDIEHALSDLPLDVAFPPAISEEVRRLLRRSQRMRIAGSEIDFATSSGSRRLSVTLAVLDQPQQRGYVLVLEDVTEVLRAQRQAAWKEVAQRVAHEIKNPLTPISLSAERIRRHIEKPTPDSSTVIRHCSDVILSSVETVRTLVDQFGALAQFPVSSPRPIDLNSVVDAALLVFAGRMDDIRIERHYASDLPLVMADKDALRRALANLIDNAAEAMQGTLHRQITLITGENLGRTMAEIIVADTGPGVTSDMRERLFLPYFSTKQRGTGLGLAIASKIVQEHQGTISVEENKPAGARFIIELPFADMTAPENAAPATAEQRS
ncbi:MAG TPA: ATP-binding protein [Acidobacteriaceae bacterium]|nr:ATP-binding protein [Acidobacteriaceae bacterium]